MTGINTALDIATQAIAANQYGLSVTGQNIANVDNANYSRQLVELQNGSSVKIGTLVFGTGVDVSQITASIDALLQSRMQDQQATASAYEEMAYNLAGIEDIFSLDTASSLDSLFSDFWNSWSDLSDNPSGVSGTAERSGVLESGGAIVAQLNEMSDSLKALSATVNSRIEVAVDSINSITAQIDDLNKSITALEAQEGVIANDLRDERTALVKELSSLIEITTHEQSSGTLLVTTANGSAILVSSGGSRELSVSQGQLMWESTGGPVDISDQIDSGSIAGWLDIRDEVIPEYEAELDALTKAFIWNVNYQHSQGVGVNYFSDTVTGSYAVDQSGLLSTLDYATSVDTATDFTMWISDGTTVEEVSVDLSTLMAPVSSANVNVSGTAGSVNDTYVLTLSPAGAEIGVDDVTINWANSQGTGSFTVNAADVPTVVEMDGIQINFSGNAGPFTGDTFVINTDADGVPSENVSDYTLQDFADAFNSAVAASALTTGVTATVSTDGQIVFTPSSGYEFAFSDESGMAAALGANTFFTGSGFDDIGINAQLSDTDYIAAGQLSAAGEIASGDNSNALLLAECGELSMQIGVYSYDRTSDPPSTSSSISTTTDSYYQTMVSNLGIITDSVNRNLETAEALMSEFQDQRDSISGVSLDEEMINLVKYQNAYNAASKLLTVADEMLDAIIATR